MGEWVRFTKRLPEVRQVVLVISESWDFPRVLVYEDFPHQRLIDRWSGWHCWYPERMYWMHLPKPPK